MSVVSAGTSVFVDLGGSGNTSVSISVTVPAGCTRITVSPLLIPAPAGVARTVSSMTFNGVALTQITGSRALNADNCSAEMWSLASPATGAHTFASTLSAACRGGFAIAFTVGDTGLGATNGAADAVVALTPAPADSSLILYACIFETAAPVAGGIFQNGVVTQALSTSRTAICSFMRGYPADPSCLTDGSAASAVVCAAVEFEGAADVIH